MSAARIRPTCIAIFIILALIGMWLPEALRADNFSVTRTDDPAPDGCIVGDCSLREAIIAANANSVADIITLPAGTYTLTRPGTPGINDTDASVSDLDIGWGGLTINGAGAGTTTISATGLGDRVLAMPIDLLFVPSTVSISGVTIRGGSTTGFAGAGNRGGGMDIGSRHATVNLTNVVVSSNISAVGGGIYSNGNLNVTNSTIGGNTGSGVTLGVDGTNFRTLTIVGSTVSGNSATGVDVDAGTANVTNSTLSGNGTSGFAGGIDYGGGRTVGTLTNVTIASNRYGYIGQNDAFGDPAVTVRNTIIAGSSIRDIFSAADAGFARAPTSGGNNIIGDNSGSSFTQPTDKRNVNPQLSLLAFNAPGTTATHALASTSPAIDMASAAFAPPTDQRGVARPQGAADDIGAYEWQPPDDDSDGYSPPADCNDNDPSIHPGATEIPDDGIDQDCNGTDTVTCFVDADHDGYGTTATVTSPDGDCSDPGESTLNTDCADGNPGVHPGATEVCNEQDDNCNGQTDEGVQLLFYQDQDGDGFGDPDVSTLACAAPPGYVADNTDCNDALPGVHPGATEIPDDGIDQDCNEFDATACFVDADGDGFGSTATLVALDGDCTDAGESTSNTDCDDASAAVYPGAPETPDDGIDQDCSGTDSVTCFVDGDADGFGSAATQVEADGNCAEAGLSAAGGDCNDVDAAIHPGATESCDGIDNDCSGVTDQGFADADADGIADCVDPDRDGDGTANDADGCPDDPNKTSPGTAGCGTSEPPDDTGGPSDTDGVADAVEDGAPNGGDGNSDGTADRQQANVTSLPNVNGDYLTIVAPAGTQLVDVSAGANPSPGDAPAGVEFPAGFVSYRIDGVAVGASIEVQIIAHLPAGTTINTFWKYGPEPGNATPHWYEFLFDGTTGAAINGTVITLTFVDGQRGDVDLSANGSVADPGAPALSTPSPAPLPASACGVCGSGSAAALPLLALGWTLGTLRRRR